MSYYAQAVRGQFEVQTAARPLDEVIADHDTADGVRERLRQVPSLRRFAVDELHLVDGGSYRTYADLRRDAVVWSVVAAPFDALEPRQWCYPVLGCASYRGYFSRQGAEAYADELTAAGWDAAVEPVPAYSTLGWFNDPLPSTVIRWPITEIAALVFHELAHETLYVAGDSAFNEAYATFVEREGVRRWLAEHGTPAQREARAAAERRRADFQRLLGQTRDRLNALYATAPPDAELRAGKQSVIAELQSEYLAQKATWNGYAGYDRWFNRPLNNAHFVSVATYNALLPGFEALFVEHGRDMAGFHAASRALADLTHEQRRERLRSAEQSVDWAGAPFSAGCRGAAESSAPACFRP